MQPSPDLLSFDKEEGPTSHRRGVLKYDGTTLSSLHQIARLPTDEMKIREGSMITNLRERIQVSQSQPRGNPKNKVKCLAINQVLRAKIHNSCLQKCVFLFYVVLLFTHVSYSLHYLSSHPLAINPLLTGSRAQVVACIRVEPHPFFSSIGRKPDNFESM